MKDQKANKEAPQKTVATDRELLELHIDLKLEQARNALRESNQHELTRIADEIHNPKIKRITTASGIIIAALVLTNLFAWLGVKERVHSEAMKLIDQKLVDPELTNTLHQALNQQAIPFISAQVHPLETNILRLSNTLSDERLRLAILSNSFVVLASTNAARIALLSSGLEAQTLRSGILSNDFAALSERSTDLQQKLDFAETVAKAENYDVAAFRELDRIGRETNATGRQAERIVEEIERRLRYDRLSQTEAILTEAQGDIKYTGPFSIDEVAEMLEFRNKIPIANYVRNSNLKEFIPELVRIAPTLTDLWEANRVTYAISSLTGHELFPWETDNLSNWWSGNSNSYKDWPYDKLHGAIYAFAMADYRTALTNFQQVLAFAPTADKARAHAVISSLKCQDFQLASNLFLSFPTTDGRWRGFAEANLRLSSGDINGATALLASVATNFPTMKAIHRVDDIWRGIDWAKYDLLISTATNTPKPRHTFS